MDSITINNNKEKNHHEENNEPVDIENSGTDQESERRSPVSPVPNGPSQANVNSFLKFSIQNILQQAAASNGAAAIAAAATRRSSDLIQADMAAAVINDFDMKRAMGALPFW